MITELIRARVRRFKYVLETLKITQGRSGVLPDLDTNLGIRDIFLHQVYMALLSVCCLLNKGPSIIKKKIIKKHTKITVMMMIKELTRSPDTVQRKAFIDSCEYKKYL